MKNRKLKFGGFSALVTLLFIAGVILLNVIVTQLTNRFFLKADLTEQGIYTLTEQTTEVLGSISADVKITVLAEESLWMNDIRNRIVETLRSYAAESNGAIEISFIDPALNPQLKTQYPLIADLSENHIIIESEKRYTSVIWSDLFDWTYDENYNSLPTALNAEQKLTGSILYVLSDSIARAVFLEGHDESSTAGLQMLLEKANYECETINIGFNEIPEDTVLLISASPKNDFITAEIDRLDAYMKDGGNAIILYEINTPKLDNLELYLEEWGIAVESKLVLDTQYNFGIAYAVAGIPGSNDKILPSLAKAGKDNYLVMNVSRPIKNLWASGSRGMRTLSPIIFSMPGSYAKQFSENAPIETAEKTADDDTGPFILGILSHDDAENPSSMIVANYGLIDEAALGGGSYYFNGQMAALIANDLNTLGQSVVVESKTLAGTHMTVMPVQARAILILMVIVMPLLILFAGMLVWRKRKRL